MYDDRKTYTKDKKLKLLTKYAFKDLNTKKYENAYIGTELEADGIGHKFQDLCDELNCPYGTVGVKREIKEYKYGGVEVKIPVDVNLYKETNIVVGGYKDGSIEHEIVTRPILLKHFDTLLKPVFDKMKFYGAEFFSEGRGGLHLTFVLDHHQDSILSEWDKIVVQNLIQLTRAYYKELCLMFGETLFKDVGVVGGEGIIRMSNYRRINTKKQVTRLSEKDTLQNMADKYYGINPRYIEGTSKIWAVEVRFPDGTNDWNRVKEQAIFWSAMIRLSAKISKYGLIEIPQKLYDEQLQFSNNIARDEDDGYRNDEEFETDWRAINISECRRSKYELDKELKELNKLLKKHLEFYKEGIVGEDCEHSKKEKAVKMRLEGKTLEEIGSKMEGNNKTKNHKLNTARKLLKNTI